MSVVIRMTFDVTKDDYDDFWNTFYEKIKGANTSKFNIPIIGPAKSEGPWNWAIVGVKEVHLQISLLIRVESLYLYGWRKGSCGTDNKEKFLVVNDMEPRNVPEGFLKLPFGGNYSNIPKLDKIVINRGSLARSIGSLFHSTVESPHNRAQEAFAAFIITFCASFKAVDVGQFIKGALSGEDDGTRAITAQHMDQEKHWRHASISFIKGESKTVDGYGKITEDNASEKLSLALCPVHFNLEKLNLPPSPGWRVGQSRGGAGGRP